MSFPRLIEFFWQAKLSTLKQGIRNGFIFVHQKNLPYL